MQQYEKVVVLGGFNITFADINVYDDDKRCNSIFCSVDEHRWFQRILALDLSDCLKMKQPENSQHTWWDYSMNTFKCKLVLRIVHIFVNETLKDKMLSVDVDENARSWKRPSDHAPITLEVA